MDSIVKKQSKLLFSAVSAAVSSVTLLLVSSWCKSKIAFSVGFIMTELDRSNEPRAAPLQRAISDSSRVLII
jgi:hypothetical protein